MEKNSSRNNRRISVPGWPSKFPDHLMVIRSDTREQSPWEFNSCFGDFSIVVDTVRHGDYVLDIDPTIACVERKSLPDFVACVGRDKDRFDKQIAGMVGAVERPLLIVEADYGMLEVGSGWRGKMTPEAVLAGLHRVQSRIPTLLCRSRGEAERACFRHLRLALKSRYEQSRQFARLLHSQQDPKGA